MLSFRECIGDPTLSVEVKIISHGFLRSGLPMLKSFHVEITHLHWSNLCFSRLKKQKIHEAFKGICLFTCFIGSMTFFKKSCPCFSNKRWNETEIWSIPFLSLFDVFEQISDIPYWLPPEDTRYIAIGCQSSGVNLTTSLQYSGE